MGGDERATVLVVEDEDNVADLFENVLSEEYHVRRAANGGEALSKLDDGVDVVLLDRRMPDISGDQALDEIEARGLNCRVAMVTAVDPDFDVIDMGFDDYLSKPVRADELRETVERLRRLDTYEQKYQELSSKIVKRNILEVEKTETELTANERFRQLQARIEELETELERLESEEEFDERLLPS
jgi:DNA-binding response OmpR family regulator